MKLLYTLAFLLFCTTAISQTYKWNARDFIPKYPLYRYKLGKNIRPPFYDTIPRAGNLFMPLWIHSSVVSLPQDNMPCVVPPRAITGKITNFWKPTVGQIWVTPNLAEPFKLEDFPKN
jgi:hypothetical protein